MSDLYKEANITFGPLVEVEGKNDNFRRREVFADGPSIGHVQRYRSTAYRGYTDQYMWRVVGLDGEVRQGTHPFRDSAARRLFHDSIR